MKRAYVFGRRPRLIGAEDKAALEKAHLKRIRKQFKRLSDKDRGGFKGSVE